MNPNFESRIVIHNSKATRFAHHMTHVNISTLQQIANAKFKTKAKVKNVFHICELVIVKHCNKMRPCTPSGFIGPNE
jgi:hypothetical protein